MLCTPVASQSLPQSPQQQGGNDPATAAVMMESVGGGGLAASVTLLNKSPNNSVNIRADPATRSNTLTDGQPPHMTPGKLSRPARQLLQSNTRFAPRPLMVETSFGPQNPAGAVDTISVTQDYFNPIKLYSLINNVPR